MTKRSLKGGMAWGIREKKTFQPAQKTAERKMPIKCFTKIFLCFCYSTMWILLSSAGDTITPAQPIRDRTGNTVVSAGKVFELGFFSPGSSRNRYLGIWYHDMWPLTVVWVANRVNPIADFSGVLNLTHQGTLLLFNGTTSNTLIWSANSSTQINPVAQLLDSGNFVIRDENKEDPDRFSWQSFDFPSDTLLPGMKVGLSKLTGKEKHLSAWKTSDDPSPGEFTASVDPDRYAQIVLKKGSVPLGISGPWNGIGFSGTPGFRANPYFKYEFFLNSTDRYYGYQQFNKSLITRFSLNETGLMQRLIWLGKNQGWNLYLSARPDNCFRYALCGPYAKCNANNLPVCGCLRGFKPKSPILWDSADWSKGCTRTTRLGCKEGGDGFVKYSGVKLPDALHYWHNGSMRIEECRLRCLNNCSCTAYANPDIREGKSGCLLWFEDLLDMRDSFDNGQDLYIRMAASELERVKLDDGGSSTKRRATIIGIIVAVIVMLLLCLCLVYIWKKKRNERKDERRSEAEESVKENTDLPVFGLATIACATGNFSLKQKLGEGGYGPVYKGVLEDGREIAVKRLSRSSNQGIHEFKNEVMHIAKLQHRNLVRLLGCCIQDGEKMLVYEYMPNKSLDFFIYDQTESVILDWPKRLHIINGIARGILYLHQDSRLRIIHRDLKASNVLLDRDMNPKIADFGMARSFGGDEADASTKRVVGTYGYMAPEYAIDGLYSTKSDVYSFGVLVLEIISGKRNRGFMHSDHHLNLLGHAWKLHREERSLELVDESMKEWCNSNELLRSIHLGLLCVQQYPEDRPNMSSVVLILGSEGTLPAPKQPGFFMERDAHGADSSSSTQDMFSGNNMTITMLEAR